MWSQTREVEQFSFESELELELQIKNCGSQGGDCKFRDVNRKMEKMDEEMKAWHEMVQPKLAESQQKVVLEVEMEMVWIVKNGGIDCRVE